MSVFIRLFFLAAFFLLQIGTPLVAQDSIVQYNAVRPVKTKPVIAVLLPLYLDSAFDAGGQYRFGKQFPRYILPGLEFYEGMQLAIDSLKKENIALDIHVIDTRSTRNIGEILKLPAVQQANLLVAHVANNEIRQVADFAGKKQVPFINVNLPNDAGVTNNPFMVILNSTLATHCEGMYKFLQKNYSTSPIIVFRKAGVQEDRLKAYLTDVEKSTTATPLKLKYVTLPSGFGAENLLPYLDSNRVTMAVAGSLDEQFARNLSTHLAALNKTYPVRVMGMPTWDGIRDFDRPEYRDLEIFYSTPFNPIRTDSLSESINIHFRDYLYSRPSDMVFRGYETIYRFGKLLAEQGSNIASGLGEKKYRVFTDFDIQPVLLNKQQQQLDYFENKKMYIIKKVNGSVSTVL
ncbi:hypothetical protein ACFSQD_07885 [Flavihumibacter stibioxidans]|uniref:Leucine-binding protein domain-containing protein n=1 Tax=Flavihumibacter stibioxidans TaxID=1834163 RepID=A0ABR7M5C3_9BACT|nr:hypothetical protein [Flavihumibacter stibioxidans]MBC6490227.1 hypothetical protein [Flavihumibacter stibioxidans]